MSMMRGYGTPAESIDMDDKTGKIVGAVAIAVLLAGAGVYSYTSGMWNSHPAYSTDNAPPSVQVPSTAPLASTPAPAATAAPSAMTPSDVQPAAAPHVMVAPAVTAPAVTPHDTIVTKRVEKTTRTTQHARDVQAPAAQAPATQAPTTVTPPAQPMLPVQSAPVQAAPPADNTPVPAQVSPQVTPDTAPTTVPTPPQPQDQSGSTTPQ